MVRRLQGAQSKSITFEGYDVPDDLVDLVQSEQAPFDTYEAWFNFKQNCIDALPSMPNGREFYEDNNAAVDELLMRAMMYDKEGFHEQQMHVMRLAVEWVEVVRNVAMEKYNDQLKELTSSINTGSGSGYLDVKLERLDQ